MNYFVKVNYFLVSRCISLPANFVDEHCIPYVFICTLITQAETRDN